MTALRPSLSPAPDQPKLASDIVIPNVPAILQDAIGDALRQTIDRSVEAKVEARLAALLEGIGAAFFALDGEGRCVSVNRAAQDSLGIPAQDMLGRVVWDAFPHLAGTELRARCAQVAATGIAAAFEAEIAGAPGAYLEFRVFPYGGGLGVSFRDWSERHRIEEELRESQARLSSMTDNVPACMVYQISDAADYRDRRLLYISKTCERLNGIPAEEVQGNLALLYELVLPPYRERMLAKEVEAVRERRAFDMEFEMRHGRTGEVRWHRLVVTPRRLANGTHVWDGIQIDITDHKRAEEHLRLLVNELNHRVKNTLATVQSLASQSFGRLGARGDDDLRAAYGAFEARLFALARGHDVLTRENWEGANLSDIVREACAPFRLRIEDEGRIAASGEELRITPAMALSLSMALHELCTNALKYGALTSATGGVRIAWVTNSGPGGPRLVLRWEEHGGPPVAPPRRKGFGSRLIEKGLARELNGSAEIAYEPDGVVCTIDVPLEAPVS